MTEEKSKPDLPDSDDMLLDHEYDGIQEYDNPLPRWWVWIFWGSFLFAGGYFFHYQLSPRGTRVLAGYAAEEREAKAKAAAAAIGQTATEQSLGIVLADVTAVEAGKNVFVARCVLCHADRGQGNIGPNLTDNRWIHGDGKLMDIYTVVTTGVDTKGMPGWEKQLAPTEIRQVVAYVGSIRNTNLPGKAAEGKESSSP